MIRVLVVDDVHLIRRRLSVAVEAFNDTTVVSGTAANGEQALEWLSHSFADLCITDIRMPIMDGLQLINQINEQYPWMMCMVVSSYDDFEYAKKSIQLNALDYITKPIEDAILTQSLQKATDKIKEIRERDAARLLIKRLPHHRTLMEKWLNHVRELRLETFPLLIVETLELLELWVEDNYYLLGPLANLWLQTAIEELTNERFQLQWDEGKDVGLGGKCLPYETIRSYFRLCAVRRLEEGAYRLVEVMRGTRDQQATRTVKMMKQYISEHCGEPINLQELAELVSMSKTYMSTLFKQEMEMTVGNYIVAERMKLARNKLLETSDKVYEIANQVGYEDVNYFSQQFKKHFGLSPLDYRKRMNS
ncbi:response regulator [Paenibacillus sp. GCM10023252]|uniref:response regulator transcription factor n=1 Tax=Paenibacillus sp. GCM10023252 TaxID=3252649 RepID=UPI003622E2E2